MNVTRLLLITYQLQRTDKSETGRATRGAAMALKSRALLYSASPLFNKSGNIDKWKSAARAAADVIEKLGISVTCRYRIYGVFGIITILIIMNLFWSNATGR